MSKKWYDDWFLGKDTSGYYEVRLPHSASDEKSIVIKGKYTKKHIEFLFMALLCALDELTTRDTYERQKIKETKKTSLG